MRLLFLINKMNTPYGAQMQIMELSRAYVRKGHQVAVLHFSNRNVYADLFDELGIVHQRIRPTPNFYRPWLFRQTARSVMDFCNTFQPDIIQSHLETADVVGQQVTLKTGTPHIISFRTDHWWSTDMILGRSQWHPRNLASMWRIYYRRYWLRRGKPTYLAVSRRTAYYAARGLRIPVDRVGVMHNGLDIQKFGPSAWLREENNPDKLIISSVARLTTNKGLDLLIRAVAQPQLRDLPLEIWLIGDGELEDTLKDLTRQLGQEDRVKFLGLRDDVPDLLRQTHIYVHPALTDAFGNAALEAVASGLPVVITEETNGTKDIIQTIPGLGRIVPTSNVEALAAAIYEFACNPALCRQQARMAHDLAQQYDIGVVAQRYLDLYERILQGAPQEKTVSR